MIVRVGIPDFTVKNTELAPAHLWAHIGPGDDARPVLTIMLQGED